MKVQNNFGEIEQFKPILIKNKIIAETGLNEEEADKIKESVVKLIHKQFKEEITTSTIRNDDTATKYEGTYQGDKPYESVE